ncbi:ATP-binding protein [Streptomyces mirabilis]|uniref:ATP-binding protein n=1 Tax=Streptomyces mirabilis TaxID=68239 RepID=UPI0036767982
MTVTVFGTGTLHAVAVDEWPARPDPVPDLVVNAREFGFVAEMTASLEAFSAVRGLTLSVPASFGADPDLAESAQLVVSELMGNVMRASPENERVPLIVEVYATPTGIEVIVHDAVPERPHRRDVALDSTEAVSGRGLALIDMLTDGWTVEPSPLGKKIRCHLSSAE